MTRTVSTMPPSLRFSSLDTLIGLSSFVCRTRNGFAPGSDGLSACPQGPLDKPDAVVQQKTIGLPHLRSTRRDGGHDLQKAGNPNTL